MPYRLIVLACTLALLAPAVAAQAPGQAQRFHPAVIDTTNRVASRAIPAGGERPYAVYCPAGWRAIGGGYSLTEPQNVGWGDLLVRQAQATWEDLSAVGGEPSQYRVVVRNTGGVDEPGYTVQLRAICIEDPSLAGSQGNNRRGQPRRRGQRPDEYPR